MIFKDILEAEIFTADDEETVFALISPKEDLSEQMIMRIMDEIIENQKFGITSLAENETEIEYFLVQIDDMWMKK